MNIYFVLPKVSRYPVGGYKMTFEYAKRLNDNDNHIYIIFLNDQLMVKYHLPEFVRKILANKLTEREPKWFDLPKEVTKISGSYDMDISSLNADVVVATSVDTVSFVKRFNCKKCYFIQGYEDWSVGQDYLNATYASGMTNIVIADWLKKEVDKYAKTPSILIKNAIDTEVYKINTSISDRFPHSISALYNEDPNKGFSYLWEALEKIHRQYPDLKVFLFGRIEYPGKLPNWVEYTANAPQDKTVEIYNKTRVFLCASIKEGFGLTGLEAMACGNVLVSTDYEGVHEYAVNEENALLSPVKDIDGLVNNVCRVFENEQLSERIRKKTEEDIVKFSWDIAIKKFANVLVDYEK